MRKLILRGIVVLAVLALLLLLLFRNRLPFGSANSNFACDPKDEITRIEFSSGDKRLTLEKKGETWLVGGTREVRKNGILFITKVLREIRIKSPVSTDLFNTEIKEKGIAAERIKVYSGRKLIRSFLVYKTASNPYGNIMKIRESSKPFIVFVPGFDGEIGSAFTLSELFWQPYTIFNLLPSEIATVDFENFADTASSFRISAHKHHFVLSAPSKPLAGWDSALVTRYLSYFAYIPFEKWDTGMGAAEKKKIELSVPLYRISVLGTTGKKSVLTMWELVHEEKGKQVRDSDRLLGKTQANDEFFILRYFDIDPLIKKRSYFFTE
jgi:hypothetical protein